MEDWGCLVEAVVDLRMNMLKVLHSTPHGKETETPEIRDPAASSGGPTGILVCCRMYISINIDDQLVTRDQHGRDLTMNKFELAAGVHQVEIMETLMPSLLAYMRITG